MKVRALYWWIDRWRRSTAYTDMTWEQQAAYRNLLDEAALRGGAIPNDAKVLAKASGDATRWHEVSAVVMARFRLKRDGWHNETLDGVLSVTAHRSARQHQYRKGGNGSPPHNAGHNAGHNAPHNKRPK